MSKNTSKKLKQNGAIVRPDTREISLVSIYNRYSTYPSHGLTPEKLTNIFKEADQGDIYHQSELFEEMLEKDPHLFGIFQSRKLAVLKRDYQIIAASDTPADQDIADFVAKTFDNIRNWKDTLGDILDAVPKGFSMLQIIWNISGSDIIIDRLEWAHQKNFRFGKSSDVLSDLKEIRRITDDNRFDGIELEPNKWVKSIVKARSGHPSRTSLLRTCAWMYLFKNFDVKAWIQFAELFGIPIRIGKYPATESSNEKLIEDLESALRNLGQDAAAVIPDSTMIEFVETAQKAATASMHGELASFCNGEMSKAVLGHTGSSDSTPGKLGSEDAAKEVRFDLVQSDSSALDYIICDQIIKPLVDFNFGQPDKYPSYKTIIEPPVDRLELVNVYNGAINQIGLPVSRQHVYDVLGIPAPKEDEEVIMPRPQQINPFAASAFSHVIAGDSKKKLHQ